jgi:hypothetical protein
MKVWEKENPGITEWQQPTDCSWTEGKQCLRVTS